MSTSYPKKKIDNYFLSNLNESIEVKKNLYKQKKIFTKYLKLLKNVLKMEIKFFFLAMEEVLLTPNIWQLNSQ